jgi:hypothetical protein
VSRPGLRQTILERQGDRLFITISAPGQVSERVEVLIRKWVKPLWRALRSGSYMGTGWRSS